MQTRKPPTSNQSVYASLDQLMSAPESALQAFCLALSKGTRAQLSAAITQVKKHELNPDAVVFRCASSKAVFWYHPAALVLACARPNAHILLKTMLDHGMDIIAHRCGPVQPGQSRTLAHAFVQGWSSARAAPVRKIDPNSPVDVLASMLEGERHRLDSRPLLKLLDEHGLDWTAPDSNGQTILHQAMGECEVQDLRTVTLLAVSRGVDPAHRDNQGQTAQALGRRRLAQSNGFEERESLQFVLAELSQASMNTHTRPAVVPASRPSSRI